MRDKRSRRPSLIVVGGFAGTGKTTLSRHLSVDLGLPRLGADSIGRTIRGSEAIKGRDVDAQWIAHDVLFRLCEEFLRSGVSVILDINMGWAFQWERIDTIARDAPETLLLPIILCCPREVCLNRIRHRHAARPEYYDPPDLFVTDQKILATWEILEAIDRPDVRVVDATRDAEAVYKDVRQYLATRGLTGN